MVGALCADPVNPVCFTLKLTAAGAIAVFNYDDVFTGYATPSGFVSPGEYHHYEFLVTLNGSTGTIAFYRDTNLVYTTPAFGTFTGTYPNGVVVGGKYAFTTGNALSGYIDDFYVCNTSGGQSLPVGDCKSLISFPDAAGHETDFGVVGVTGNWQAVSENPPLGDAAYVYSDTVSDKDAYTMTPLASSYTSIIGISEKMFARKTDAGNRQIALGFSDGTSDAVGPGNGVGTTYGYTENVSMTNPLTSDPFDSTAMATLQMVLEIAS
jgi:hypothetical protein